MVSTTSNASFSLNGQVVSNGIYSLTEITFFASPVVNKETGKPEFDCNPFKLDLIYLKVFLPEEGAVTLP